MPRKKKQPPDPQPQIPVLLPIDACQPTGWNPNVEDLATFNELVESIKKHGFNENITVVANPDGEACSAQHDTCLHPIIAGEHRWKAAKLAGLTHVTAIIKDWSEDEQKIQSVRMNILRGRFDAPKFASLWSSLEKKYGRPALMRLMGMGSKEKELERLLGQVKRRLPDEMKEELARRADKIRNVEDLAAVVQSLYAQFGSTLQHGYIFFSFGGQTHLMVQLSKKTLDKLKGTLAVMGERGQNANELVERALFEAANAPLVS